MQLRTNTITFSLLFFATTTPSFATERHAFSWSDINTRSVVEWDGDTAIVRRGTSMQELSCKIEVDEDEVTRSTNMFGIPNAWTSITYRDQQELEEKQRKLQVRARKHGIKMLREGNRFIVDYAWVVQNSSQGMKEVARTIRSTARRNGYRSVREIVGAFASFAQSLEYRVPPDHRMNEEGERILTAGAMMPLDTLTKAWGDCDSKSLLFASLVKSINLVDVCFLVLEDHLFAGVRLTPTKEDHAIRYKGRDWILIELTDAWPVGRIPQEHLKSIAQDMYEVVDLN